MKTPGPTVLKLTGKSTFIGMDKTMANLTIFVEPTSILEVGSNVLHAYLVIHLAYFTQELMQK
ncbi:MAG: hypothetical protein GX956_08385 [Firmicutes bacterium]|nr:hypothetical protein [Bacillota bacterium]